jgi:hypothetical protein
MSPAFNDRAFFQYNNPVCVSHGAQAVRDNNNRSVPKKTVQIVHDDAFITRI